MGIKRRIIGRTRLYLKNMGVLGWVPLAVINIFIPAVLVAGYLHYGSGSVELDVLAMQVTQALMPLFSVWWSLFLLRDYVESDGRELLHIAVQKRELREAVKPFLLVAANILMVLVLGSLLTPVLLFEVIRILSVCVFLFGLSYCLVYLFRSISMAFFGVVLYTLINWFAPVDTPVFPLYMSNDPLEARQFLTVCFPLIVAGFALMLLGVLCNRKFFDYG